MKTVRKFTAEEIEIGRSRLPDPNAKSSLRWFQFPVFGTRRRMTFERRLVFVNGKREYCWAFSRKESI